MSITLERTVRVYLSADDIAESFLRMNANEQAAVLIQITKRMTPDQAVALGRSLRPCGVTLQLRGLAEMVGDELTPKDPT